MGWFEGSATKEKKAAVKNLIAVMSADGDIHDNESKYLGQVCQRIGLSPQHLVELMSAPDKVKFKVPKTVHARAQQLADLIFMMLADGKVDKREMDVCMALASQMGFAPSVVPEALKSALEGIRDGGDRSKVSVDVGSFLGQ